MCIKWRVSISLMIYTTNEFAYACVLSCDRMWSVNACVNIGNDCSIRVLFGTGACMMWLFLFQ